MDNCRWKGRIICINNTAIIVVINNCNKLPAEGWKRGRLTKIYADIVDSDHSVGWKIGPPRQDSMSRSPFCRPKDGGEANFLGFVPGGMEFRGKVRLRLQSMPSFLLFTYQTKSMASTPWTIRASHSLLSSRPRLIIQASSWEKAEQALAVSAWPWDLFESASSSSS